MKCLLLVVLSFHMFLLWQSPENVMYVLDRAAPYTPMIWIISREAPRVESHVVSQITVLSVLAASLYTEKHRLTALQSIAGCTLLEAESCLKLTKLQNCKWSRDGWCERSAAQFVSVCWMLVKSTTFEPDAGTTPLLLSSVIDSLADRAVNSLTGETSCGAHGFYNWTMTRKHTCYFCVEIRCSYVTMMNKDIKLWVLQVKHETNVWCF